jgi:hypothetical protein
MLFVDTSPHSAPGPLGSPYTVFSRRRTHAHTFVHPGGFSYMTPALVDRYFGELLRKRKRVEELRQESLHSPPRPNA